MKQVVNVEIIMEFNDHPIVDIQFRYVHLTIYHHWPVARSLVSLRSIVNGVSFSLV